MTIPFLRSREYRSILSTPKKIVETSSYTSFTTNYLSDGYRVNALLVIPKGVKPGTGWPAVIFVHGYIPPNQYKTTSNYNSFVLPLATRGIAVLKIDLRGHGTSEGTASGSYYSSDFVIDTLNAYSALSAYKEVNRSSISLWGHSMAGNIVLRSIAVAKNIPKAVIWAGAGYTYEDLQTLRIRDSSYRPPPSDSPQQKYRRELFETHGQFDPSSDFWQQVPATNYLDGVTTAIALHHAIDDTVVSIDYSRSLNSILRKAGLSTSLYEYTSGGHNLTGSTFNQAINRTAEFLK